MSLIGEGPRRERLIFVDVNLERILGAERACAEK
jgi:hypothetical protein